MTKLVYIGGYGHSGSTLLEYLLAASPEAVACGEVASVLRDRDRKGKCTCRRPIKECPVWGPLFASPDTLDGMSHEDLSRALLAQDRDAHAILINSTKTAWRSAAVPFRLASALGGDFTLVHLVRDPRAVAWSGVKKAGRRGTRPLLPLRSASAALGWWVANLACELFGSKYPDRYVRLRYEDLARAPSDEMQGLFAKLVPGSSGPPRRSADTTTGISSMATACAPRTCLSPRSGKTQRGSATCRASTARSSRSSPRRFAGATATLKSRERAPRMRVARLRNRNQEVHHASQIGSATKGRRCCALRQARQDEPEQAQGRIAQHVQIDERETARRVCLDQAQGQAGACCEAAHEEVGVAFNGAEIASAQEYGAEDHGA